MSDDSHIPEESLEAEKNSHLWLADEWVQNRSRLQSLLGSRIPPVLQRRLGIDDLLQECYLACGKRISFFLDQPEVPIYVKFRRIALQTLADMERHHLGAAKRDAMKEVHMTDKDDANSSNLDAWERFADTMTSPRTRLVKLERQSITRRVLEELSDNDRKILELRHFEELTNTECAAILEIEAKTASIRYVRALKRFQELIMQFSVFQD